MIDTSEFLGLLLTISCISSIFFDPAEFYILIIIIYPLGGLSLFPHVVVLLFLKQS